MSTPVLIAALYLGQLWVKSALALWKRAADPNPPRADLRRLTIIQPVTSGDAKLGEVLEYTVRELEAARIVWIIDRPDDTARRLCQALKEHSPARDILILEADEPPAGVNPKLWKQIAALPSVRTDLLAVIDDDTRVPKESVDALIGALDGGADLATGLPSYVAAGGSLSRLVAEFVNTSAITTYLSAAACVEPISINGMCYAASSRFVQEHDLFSACSRSVTDDLAIAKAVRAAGGHIVQTARPQHISTDVTSLKHYRRLMHRWFVFTRVLVQGETPLRRLMLILAFGVHPLLFGALLAVGVSHPWLLLTVLFARSATIALLNRYIVGSWRHSPLASIAAELLQPLFFVGAFFRPVIWWRRRKIRVLAFDRFEYLSG